MTASLLLALVLIPSVFVIAAPAGLGGPALEPALVESTAMFTIAVGAAVALLVAAQLASIPRRRARAAVLRDIGWTGGELRQWMFAEEVPAAVLVIAGGAAAVLLSGVTPVSIVLVSAAMLFWVGAAVIATAAGSMLPSPPTMYTGRRARRESASSGTPTSRGRRLTSFGTRQSRIHWTGALLSGASIVVVTLAAAGLAAVVVIRGDELAAVIATLGNWTAFVDAVALEVPVLAELALGVLALVAGFGLAIVGRRADLRRRAPQWVGLRAMGWTRRDVRTARVAETLVVLVPALVVSTAAAWGAALALETASPLLVAAVAVTAGLLGSLASLLAGRRVRAGRKVTS